MYNESPLCPSFGDLSFSFFFFLCFIFPQVSSHDLCGTGREGEGEKEGEKIRG